MTPTIRGGAFDTPHNATLRVWHRGVWHLPNRKNLNRDPSLVEAPALGFRCLRVCRMPARA